MNFPRRGRSSQASPVAGEQGLGAGALECHAPPRGAPAPTNFLARSGRPLALRASGPARIGSLKTAAVREVTGQRRLDAHLPGHALCESTRCKDPNDRYRA